MSVKRKRIFRNRKLVFAQIEQKIELDSNGKKYLEKNEEYECQKIIKIQEVNKLIQKNKKPRGRKYRGVSKNGRHWQVSIMIKKKKMYMGSYSNEDEAARVYDKVALQYHGNKAITNYDYTKDQIEKLLEMNKK